MGSDLLAETKLVPVTKIPYAVHSVGLQYDIRLIDSVLSYTLPNKGRVETSVPDMDGLQNTIAYELTMFPFKLAIAEFRFLRELTSLDGCLHASLANTPGYDFWTSSFLERLSESEELIFRIAVHDKLTSGPDAKFSSKLTDLVNLRIRPRPKTTQVVAIAKYNDRVTWSSNGSQTNYDGTWSGTWSVFLKMDEDPVDFYNRARSPDTEKVDEPVTSAATMAAMYAPPVYGKPAKGDIATPKVSKPKLRVKVSVLKKASDPSPEKPSKPVSKKTSKTAPVAPVAAKAVGIKKKSK